MAACGYCGGVGDTRDHILPRARGRMVPNLARNLRPACAPCNTDRAVLWHCPAALAAVRAVQQGTGETLRAWVRRVGVRGMLEQGAPGAGSRRTRTRRRYRKMAKAMKRRDG